MPKNWRNFGIPGGGNLRAAAHLNPNYNVRSNHYNLTLKLIEYFKNKNNILKHVSKIQYLYHIYSSLIYLFIYIFIDIFVYLFIYSFIYLFIKLINLFIDLFISLATYLFFYLFIYISIYIYIYI